ncbi:MAG: cobyrinate a,c-diamide synthase [Bacillota bacterium]
MKLPRLVIAGTHSGVGKTTITSGLMQFLVKKGIRVQGFKVGPDYIDPSYHTLATNRNSRNLDSWMFSEEAVLELVNRTSSNSDLVIIEGVMGLFDGFGGNSDLGSTAHIAKITKSPVILVVDTRSMARSIAALIQGYMSYDADVNIAGVILNKVASERHLQILQEAIKPLNIPVVGHIFRDTDLGMPERHLGLVPAIEKDDLKEHLLRTGQKLENYVEINVLLNISRSAVALPQSKASIFSSQERGLFDKLPIGYAYDQAFNFYYWDNLDYLQHLGAELIPFSPLKDQSIPKDVCGLIIGGGFPELFLERLSNNREFIHSLRQAYNLGIPIYAECGGFMYLTQEISDFFDNTFKMVGLIPGKCKMTKKLAGMGYREGIIKNHSLLGEAGTYIKGHEFHYSRFEPEEESPEKVAFQYKNGNCEGYCDNYLLASYLHLHFASNPSLAQNFLKVCNTFKKEGNT